MKTFEIYTDGSKRNVGRGSSGWSYIILEDDKKIFSDSGRGTSDDTNNQMELRAAIYALSRLEKAAVQQACALLHSDSAYMVNCFNDDWISSWKKKNWINSKKQPVANKELWLELERLVQKYQVRFKHVKGGSNSYIKLVDRLAKKESR